MKVPRDISGEELARLLRGLGYQVTRQTGSHMRLSRTAEVKHHITIPRHETLRVGTLNSILKDIAKHLGIRKDQLVQNLWGEP